MSFKISFGSKEVALTAGYTPESKPIRTEREKEIRAPLTGK
jgi:hypothetical protein